jgi:hypothetical protein
VSSEAISEQDKEIIKTCAAGLERDMLTDLLIMNWTGKNLLEQGKIIRETYENGGTKGKPWYEILADRSKSRMVELSKKMGDRDVSHTLYRMRQSRRCKA